MKFVVPASANKRSLFFDRQLCSPPSLTVICSQSDTDRNPASHQTQNGRPEPNHAWTKRAVQDSLIKRSRKKKPRHNFFPPQIQFFLPSQPQLKRTTVEATGIKSGQQASALNKSER